MTPRIKAILAIVAAVVGLLGAAVAIGEAVKEDAK